MDSDIIQSNAREQGIEAKVGLKLSNVKINLIKIKLQLKIKVDSLLIIQ